MVVWLLQRAAVGLSLAPFGVEDEAVLQEQVPKPMYPGAPERFFNTSGLNPDP